MSDPRAKKSFGQNFLKSKVALRAMISAGDIVSGDTVLEIGPGKGALTEPLLETGARVIAFELDPRMVEFLSERFAEQIARGQLQIVQADVLEQNLADYFETGNYKVAANIPYYITNAILRMFLESNVHPSSMTLLVQKEVAQRIIANDGKHSLLSLSVQAFAQPKMIMKVGAQHFSPKPKVDSAIIHIADISHNRFANINQKTFFDILHAGFAHKRKMLLKNLQSLQPKSLWEPLFNEISLDAKTRAEDLTLDEWFELAKGSYHLDL